MKIYDPNFLAVVDCFGQVTDRTGEREVGAAV